MENSTESEAKADIEKVDEPIPLPAAADVATPDSDMEDSQEAKEAKAEEFKTQGNEFFKNWKYQEAYDAYSKAVDVNVGGAKQCVYLSNRAFASLRLENYGIAIIDAKAAIDIDPNYIKAYYRRGCAYLALTQIASAVKDFRKVCKIVPKDKDARLKYNETVKLK